MRTFGRLLLVPVAVLLALTAAYYAYFAYQRQHDAAQNRLYTVSRDGIVTQIHALSRLETMAYHVDTVVTSEKQGSWYKLWQDQEKGLFVVKGEVMAGVDLGKLDAADVSVSADGKQAVIDLPAAELFSVHLSDIRLYDYKRGWLYPEPVSGEVLNQVQAAAKNQVRQTACQADILKLASDNAAKQVTRLFELTGTSVKVNTAPIAKC